MRRGPKRGPGRRKKFRMRGDSSHPETSPAKPAGGETGRYLCLITKMETPPAGIPPRCAAARRDSPEGGGARPSSAGAGAAGSTRCCISSAFWWSSAHPGGCGLAAGQRSVRLQPGDPVHPGHHHRGNCRRRHGRPSPTSSRTRASSSTSGSSGCSPPSPAPSDEDGHRHLHAEHRYGLPRPHRGDAQLLRQPERGDGDRHHSGGLHRPADHRPAGGEGRQHGGGPDGGRPDRRL